jgi:hypothetical protein
MHPLHKRIAAGMRAAAPAPSSGWWLGDGAVAQADAAHVWDLTAAASLSAALLAEVGGVDLTLNNATSDYTLVSEGVRIDASNASGMYSAVIPSIDLFDTNVSFIAFDLFEVGHGIVGTDYFEMSMGIMPQADASGFYNGVSSRGWGASLSRKEIWLNNNRNFVGADATFNGVDRLGFASVISYSAPGVATAHSRWRVGSGSLSSATWSRSETVSESLPVDYVRLHKNRDSLLTLRAAVIYKTILDASQIDAIVAAFELANGTL